MKKLRLALAAALALGAGVHAALTTTINVTTTVDEDGINPAACSLREAVTAVNNHAPYGGCPAGHPFNDNLIQLASSANYTLTQGEIVVTAEVAIVGNDKHLADRENQINPLTGKTPRRVRPDYIDTDGPLPVGTSVLADANSRIFFSNSSLTIRDIVLKGSDTGGTAVNGNGGVIYSNGPLYLTNVIIKDGRVTDTLGIGAGAGNGGAIYIAGDGSSLTMTDVTLESSQAANTGGGVAVLCSINLNPYALHNVTIKRSLFKGNLAASGAGAIDMCGNTTASITSSTFAQNISFSSSLAVKPDSAAISYVQTGNPAIGQLTLKHITAVEQTGHVLALKGIGNALLDGSLLAFSTPGSGTVCFNPDLDPDIPGGVDAPMMSAAGAGSFNAITADASCDLLLSRPGSGDTNKDIPLTVVLSDVLAPLTTAPAFTDGGPFGLTEYYLPNEATSTYVIDKAGPFDYCSDEDQRGINRLSGTGCDVGAVERLQISVSDDTGSNKLDTDRKAVVNVLLNDTFGEDSTGPFQFVGFEPDIPATAGVNEGRPVELVNDAGGLCKWQLETLADGTTEGRVIANSPNGTLRDKVDPIICTYRIHDTNPNGIPSGIASVEITISNVSPRAKDDVYLRPVGTSMISFDPLENDDDSGDGKYGNEPVMKPAPDEDECVLDSSATANPGDCVYTSNPNWVDFYPPIEITSQPQLGEIRGARTDSCPGKVTSTCYSPPLRYIAKNSLAPFNDSFSYRVYDQEEAPSNTATVTIATDASDLDHGGGGGSFDMLGGLILGLLGLRRLLRL